MRVKMSKHPPPAPTASAVGPCPTVIQIVGRPGTGSLPSIIAPSDPPPPLKVYRKIKHNEKVCHTQEVDYHVQGQGHNQGMEVKSCLCDYSKTC